jgi:preprotein translocase subunit SecA
MVVGLVRKIFGTKNERDLKAIQPYIDTINGLEVEMRSLSDAELKAKTPYFRGLFDQVETRGQEDELLDRIMPEAFAVVREASRRTLGMRPFDVQLIGGIVLHKGNISEMKTGEGKTLVATMPLYLNSLSGKGAHLITVNDYLASRDSEWMGEIYKYLGLSFGCILHNITDEKRREAYNADITYGTNNEFGFDYLRDNMKFDIRHYVQRELNYAIVDEVDSILIDEARTPLIISGPAEESTDKYYKINQQIKHLLRMQGKNEDEDLYTIEEKSRTVVLTEAGVARMERLLQVGNLYDPQNIDVLHHVNQALKAHTLFKRDVDYVVKPREDRRGHEVLIVDEFTGRLMPGRRYSEGLHQALEAKEDVRIENENQTLASITFQNYFRMYNKLAGMTGTADTEAVEFNKIYNLDVSVIPTNEPMIRIDWPDAIYQTEEEKFKAAIGEIEDCYERGQPVLVGTISIEKSELLSKMLKKIGIPHNVLNAKHHEKEAQIVAQAGRLNAITISTNMAGRGTDIVLGGNPEFLTREEVDKEKDPERFSEVMKEFIEECIEEREDVLKAGGLHILGTERHESRRIDNQLRGRSGRQGDPGTSRFYLSLEDDLLRIFGSERIAGMMSRLGVEKDEPIEHNWISRAIENAQNKVEGHNFDIRKHLIEFDDVMNKQRSVIYSLRRDILGKQELQEDIHKLIDEVVDEIVADYAEEKVYPEEWDWSGLDEYLIKQFSFQLKLPDEEKESMGSEGLRETLRERAIAEYEKKQGEIDKKIFDQVQRFVYLQTVDNLWKDHLLGMDHLKEGIGLRGYGQRDPLREYQREGFDMFQNLIWHIKSEAVENITKVQLRESDETSQLDHKRQDRQLVMSRGGQGGESRRQAKQQPVVKGKKVGRNDPCPCGSGKKYKKCCGA